MLVPTPEKWLGSGLMSIGDGSRRPFSNAAAAAAVTPSGAFIAPAAMEAKAGKKIELYSTQYYTTCAFGGLMACGLTHAFVTPLDLVKCRRQVDKSLYSGNIDGWKKMWATEGGLRGIYTGWSPTLIGYSLQGAFKYGLYEIFKKKYSDMAGAENAVKYRSLIYLAGSASAEFFADIALCPLEALKVKMQTTIPPQFRSTLTGFSVVTKEGGIGALYRGIVPLWSRQIPYTMMKFASFEATVEAIYKSIGKPKNEFGKLEQLSISFLGGYIAGIACAVISHPADVMVSKLNAPTAPGAPKPSIGQVYGQIGFGGLWNGLAIRIAMVGTLTGLQWLIYDSFKAFSGLPTTGGAAPPAK